MAGLSYKEDKFDFPTQLLKSDPNILIKMQIDCGFTLNAKTDLAEISLSFTPVIKNQTLFFVVIYEIEEKSGSTVERKLIFTKNQFEAAFCSAEEQKTAPAFIRDNQFINLSNPGSGEPSDPNLSLELTPELIARFKKFVADSEAFLNKNRELLTRVQELKDSVGSIIKSAKKIFNNLF